MAEKTEKSILPPYIAYKSFASFIKGLRETGTPQQIDRSIFPTMSGSGQSAMITGLRFLNLVDDKGIPTKLLKQLVEASGENYTTMLRDALVESYGFLTKGDINLEQASGKQVEDKFREKGVSGSTVTKCIAFFLAMAREAGIKVSSHVRPPKPIRANGVKRSKRQSSRDDFENEEEEEYDLPNPEVQKFQIPIPGKPSAMFSIPKNLEDEDWEMLKTMLDLYIARMRKQQALA